MTLDFRLELPQVAVIGSQSSGKSSVLEALVRVCFGFCSSTMVLSTQIKAIDLRSAEIFCQEVPKYAPDDPLSFNL